MIHFGELEQGQQNLISFVMIDNAGAEVTGLGNGFTLQISKAGGAFNAGAGIKAEIGLGWYTYLTTAGETDTVGPISIAITGAGAVQQNLEYVVLLRTINSIAFTYTVTDSVTLAPIEGVQVWITTDTGGNNVVWNGATDALGVARDSADNLPRLDPGTYNFFRQKVGYTFSDPDVEIVS